MLNELWHRTRICAKLHVVNSVLVCGWHLLCQALMCFPAKLLDENQVCSCTLKIIHCLLFYPRGDTGSWWSGSAKTPNWRRWSTAARSQCSQMPPLIYHVFQAGQQCVCESCDGRGGNGTLAKTFPHWCQPDTCLGTPHGLCCHLSFSYRSAGGPLFPFSSVKFFAKKEAGASLRPSCALVVKAFRLVFASQPAGSRPLQQDLGLCSLHVFPDSCHNHKSGPYSLLMPPDTMAGVP